MTITICFVEVLSKNEVCSAFLWKIRIGSRLVLRYTLLLFQTEEWTSEQRKSHRYQESSGNEDKLEKYIRHRCVIFMNRVLANFYCLFNSTLFIYAFMCHYVASLVYLYILYLSYLWFLVICIATQFINQWFESDISWNGCYGVTDCLIQLWLALNMLIS